MATAQVRNARGRGMFAHPLAREIGVVLAAKLVLLVLGFFLLFGPATRPHLTPDAIHDRLSAAAPAADGSDMPGGSHD